MYPVLLQIGPFTIYSYGFFLVLAYFAATFIFWREGKRQGYNEEKLLDLSVISLIAAIVGGRIFYAVLNPDLFSSDLSKIISFWDGGFAYYGSLLAVFLVGVYFVHRWKWSFYQIADIAALSAAAAIVLAKIGAFLAGVDFGKLSSWPFAVEFPNLVGSRHPSQLYEAFAFGILFVFLYYYYFKQLHSRNMKSGKIFFAFIILSSFIRIFLEFFRAESHLIFNISTAMLISLVVAGIGIFALYYFDFRNFREDIRSTLKLVLGLNNKILRRLKI